jgi:CheY-like chemotaxis protein
MIQHTATTFDKPDEALAHFQTNPNAYDLVITDLTMPGMTGLDLARGIHTTRADIPIILSSGFPDEVTEETMRELGIVEVLPKPFQMQALAEAIARHR